MDNLEKHKQIEEGYKRIYEGFAEVVRKYRRAGEDEQADIFEVIANRFKDIHERYVRNIKFLKEERRKHERRTKSQNNNAR